MFAKKSFEAAPCSVLRSFRARLAENALPCLATARMWLAFAGQIEQAVCDSGGPADAGALTDAAAALFVTAWRGGSGRAARDRLLATSAGLRLPQAPATFRIPEGFAWYALYPDAYADAAQRWAEAPAAGRGPVLVVGLRSIGTGLSAVVADALARAGAAVAGRLTLRPEGHPFARRAALPDGLPDAAAAIIVDEGPGLSGSSMAAAAEALCGRGMKPDAIFFFPGHGRGPGAAASPAVRRWWTAERCVVGAAPQPPAAGAHGLRWLFGGFAAVNGRLDTLAELKRARQMRLAARGFALPSPAADGGWIGIAGGGVPLTRADLSAALMQGVLAPALMAAALPPDRETARAGIARIAAALGRDAPAAGAMVRIMAACDGLPLSGDGRLAPGGWLRQPDGRVLKADATGSDCEHDWAGPQPVLWDAAGSAAAWEMDEGLRAAWRAALARHGLAPDPLALAFHEAGYCTLEAARARHTGDAVLARRHDGLRAAALARMAVAA